MGVTSGVTACSKLPRPSGGGDVHAFSKIYIFLWHPGGLHTPPPGYGPALEAYRSRPMYVSPSIGLYIGL